MSHASYLVFTDIFETIVNDAMQTSLRGMTFQICWLVRRDKRMLFKIINKLRSNYLIHHVRYVSNDRNGAVIWQKRLHLRCFFNTGVTLASFQSSGKIPFERESLMIYNRESAKWWPAISLSFLSNPKMSGPHLLESDINSCERSAEYHWN